MFIVIILFFSVTRTQVGRDATARELEQEFAETFRGQMQIGRLSGNLLNTLFASDIEIKDPSGQTVVQIDSVIIRPKWSGLLRKSFSVHELILINPQLFVEFDQNGNSNLGQTFAQIDSVGRNQSSDQGWKMQGMAFEIRNGRVATRSPVPLSDLIAAGSLFDVGNSLLEGFSIRADLDFTEESKQIDILRVEGYLKNLDLAIDSGESQFIIKNDRITLNQFGVRIGATDLSLTGFWELKSDSASTESLSFVAELESQNVDFNELSRILPNSPLRSNASVSAYIQGPLNDLTFSWLRIGRNDLNLEVAGTISGYPGPLSIDLSVAKSSLVVSELKELLPSYELDKILKVAAFDVSAYAQGIVAFQNASFEAVEGRGSFEVISDQSQISGSILLNGGVDSLSHHVSVYSENIDLSNWSGKPSLRSNLTGNVRANGISDRRGVLFSTISGSLENFSWGSKNLGQISLDLDYQQDQISGKITLADVAGQIEIDGNVTLSDDPWIDLVSHFTNANLGPILGGRDLRTRVNGQLEASASLRWDHEFRGELSLRVDSSWISVKDAWTTVTPFESKVEMGNPVAGDDRLLTFTSDFAKATISGTGSVPVWERLASSWFAGIKSAAVSEFGKTLYSKTESDPFPDSPLEELLLLESARTAFLQGQYEAPIVATVDIEIVEGARLAQIMPAFSGVVGQGKFRSRWLMSPDTIQVNIDIVSLNGSSNSNGLFGARGNVSVGAGRQATMARFLTWSMNVEVDSLSIGSNTLGKSQFTSDFSNRSGTIEARSAGTPSVDSLFVGFEIQNTDRFNEARLTTLGITTSTGQWQIDQPSILRFFGDATSVDDFELRFVPTVGPSNQAIFAKGVFSSNPKDSLMVSLSEISLRELSGFADIQPAIGGILTTKLSLSGGMNLPKIAGSADVLSFAVDDRILGDVKLESIYSTSSPDASIKLSLSPVPNNRESVLLGTTIPATIFENDLSLSGRLRLPNSANNDLGMLDLFVNIDRADLFFLDYFDGGSLDDISGFLSGDGNITGSFSNPLFDVDLGILEGDISVPTTQGRYQLIGEVHIDDEAIHLNSVRISDPQGGRADLSGRVLFNGYQFFSLDITGRLNELQIMNVGASRSLPFYGFLRASGDLSLTGPLYDALLYSSNVETRADSELFIPVEEELSETDESFIVFEDSLGFIPDFNQLSRRPFILASRAATERKFLDGLNLDLSIFAPVGSTVHLVIDPLLGDVINAKSTGTVQLIRSDDTFQTFGQLAVDSGDYLFTAGELFYRKFEIKEGGNITWNGDPLNASLNIPASYRTRASRSGLPGADASATGLIPLIVNLQISGTVTSPQVDLSLSIDRANQNVLGDYQALEAQLNQADRATEYATSVLLTNTFQLTTENITSDSGSQLAFNSVSQLVSAQLNRFLNEALPNVDFTFGLLGESAADLDVTYGVALRLLDERLIIRGEGVYQGNQSATNVRANEGLQGEFVVEIRMSPRVSIEVFFRREGDILETSELTNTTGVGVSYQTDFESWGTLYRRITGSADEN